MRRLPLILLGWAAVILWCPRGRAAYTPEALAAGSAAIIRGTVSSVGGGGLVVSQEESILAPDNDRSAAAFLASGYFDPSAFPVGTPVVAFFDAQESAITVIPLSGPAALRDREDDPVVSLDLKPLSASGFLDALRTAARRPRAPIITIDNGGSPAPLRPRGLCIPVDDRLPAIVRDWMASSNPDARLFAASLLGQTAAPSETIESPDLFLRRPDVAIDIPDRRSLLRSLLSDPYLVDASNDMSPFMPRVYAVREVARDSLYPPASVPGLFTSEPAPAGLAALRAAIVVTAPNTQYRRFPFAWPVLLFVAMTVAIYLVARRRKWPVRLAPALLPAVLLVELGAYRSSFTADDFFWARKPFCLSLTSYQGGIELLAYDRFPGSMPLAHAAAVPDVTVGDARSFTDRYFWHQFGTTFEPGGRQLTPVRAISFGRRDVTDPTTVTGIDETTGMLSGVPYIVLPYRDLLLAAAGVMLASCFPLISIARGRWRARGGSLCPQCGFDVRAQLAFPEPRCPECGRALGARRTPAPPHTL